MGSVARIRTVEDPKSQGGARDSDVHSFDQPGYAKQITTPGCFLLPGTQATCKLLNICVFGKSASHTVFPVARREAMNMQLLTTSVSALYNDNNQPGRNDVPTSNPHIQQSAGTQSGRKEPVWWPGRLFMAEAEFVMGRRDTRLFTTAP